VIHRTERPSPTYDVALVRYNADGTLDAQFGKSGVVFTDLEPDYEQNPGPAGVALQPDGKILVGASANGPSGQDFVLTRYLGRNEWIPKWR
jgi:hypothetical protein